MTTSPEFALENAEFILDQLSEGVYITDLERRILFWNSAAERITGYNRQDVVGRHCADKILCHVDKNENLLCGHDRCPLHRSIITGNRSDHPVVIYAKHSNGKRIPVQVSVGPLIDKEGEVIGGVEVFRDVSSQMADLARARRIQATALGRCAVDDPRLGVKVHYTPQDIIGGDFYALHTVDAGTVAVLIADVMGHGISAALYTMYLRSLWSDVRSLAADPSKCLNAMNNQLDELMGDDYGFATVALATVNLETGETKIAGGGHPSPLLYRAAGGVEKISCMGFPLGMMKGTEFTEVTVRMEPGDKLLLYTDGAVEVQDHNGQELETEGLMRLLAEMLYPSADIRLQELEERILKHSCCVAHKDDLTMIELSYRPPLQG